MLWFKYFFTDLLLVSIERCGAFIFSSSLFALVVVAIDTIRRFFFCSFDRFKAMVNVNCEPSDAIFNRLNMFLLQTLWHDYDRRGWVRTEEQVQRHSQHFTSASDMNLRSMRFLITVNWSPSQIQSQSRLIFNYVFKCPVFCCYCCYALVHAAIRLILWWNASCVMTAIPD